MIVIYYNMSYTDNSHSKLFHIGSGKYQVRICLDWDEGLEQTIQQRYKLLDRLKNE